jgi:hypothetical protein
MNAKRAVLGVAALATVLTVPTVALGRAGDVPSSPHDPTPPVPSSLSPTRTPPPGVAPSPGVTPVADANGWTIVAKYTFDRGLGTGRVPDDSGNGHTLELASRYGGRIVPATRGAGLAVRYPRPCFPRPATPRSPAVNCPRAVLQARSSADLNPGARPFSWGAMVQLSARDTSPGENILQKGLRARTGQFKLQVDGTAGHPSCVLTETRTERFHEVYASVSIADGMWHRLDCVRTRVRLTLFVDGHPDSQRRIPPNLTIVNTMPLRIGGKSVFRSNDQFNGAVDNVYVAMGRSVGR